MTKAATKERAEAIAKLREWVKPGDKVYTILRQTSRSGMSRHISTLIVDKASGDAFEISGYVAKAIERRRADDGGIVAQGCGMDMGFEVVYNLSRVLFPEGFKVEGRGRNGDTSGWDKDGGYALRHVWL